jgi:polysaccharide export outer membrane protein
LLKPLHSSTLHHEGVSLMTGLKSLTVILLTLVGMLVAACGGPSGGTFETATEGDLPEVQYQLASGDKISITVFGHTDLSGEYTLDGRGNFAMPLIGTVQANQLTTSELEARIAEQYSNGYLIDPKITVQVLNYRPFYILGEVNRPGQYEYVNGMTVLNAVALAGGFTYRAKQDGVTVKRGGANAEPVLVNAATPILPGDIITVPERFF